MSVSSKMFCTMQPLACVVSYSARQASNAKASFLYWTTSKMHGPWAGSHPVAIYRYLPWRLVTSCESHSTVRTTVHVLYGAEMAIELQWHGGETAVRWEAQRWMETEGILFGQLGPRWSCVSAANTRGATKILIKSLKPHNLIHLVVHNSSQIFKMIL